MKPYYQDDAVTIYHGDSREILPALEKMDLVMTDPPYGINENGAKSKTRGNFSRNSRALAAPRNYGNFSWDKNPIDAKLMEAVLAAGKWACVWGGNYYLMQPSSSWLIWDKENGENNFADAEMAWTNWPTAVRLKRHLWNGMLRKGKEPRHHPTQKPLDVIAWAISLAPASETILDPFMGSGTTLRAAKNLKKRAVGIEQEEKYCEIAAERMAQEVLI